MTGVLISRTQDRDLHRERRLCEEKRKKLGVLLSQDKKHQEPPKARRDKGP